MMNMQMTRAKLANTTRLCSTNIEENRGTPTRVINAQIKIAETTKTLGSCSDMVEESMGSLEGWLWLRGRQ
jgi:hypothetical protein